MKKALFTKNEKCELCPHNCKIIEGKTGICGVRINSDGIIYSLNYNHPSSINLDPIEKKPLYHFFPGNPIFSIGSYGCNFFCPGCQNYNISKEFTKEFTLKKEIKVEDIIDMMKNQKCEIMAFTYNEPTIFYEYMLDIAKESKKNGFKNVIVSNGYINEKPLKKLCKYIDSANIDLKFFDKKKHKKYTKGDLSKVLETIKILKEKQIHIEITHLMINGLNDDMNTFEKMCKWIKSNVGKKTPLHISRFFPNYKMQNFIPTDISKLLNAKKIGDKYLSYVYLGNIKEDLNTYCPKCKSLAVKRENYSITDFTINGDCPSCKKKILINT